VVGALDPRFDRSRELQRGRGRANDRIRTRNDLALGLGIAAGVVAIAGGALLYWPDTWRSVIVVPGPSGVSAAVSLSF
jgi:hypothetical protein